VLEFDLVFELCGGTAFFFPAPGSVEAPQPIIPKAMASIAMVERIALFDLNMRINSRLND
jgi:hypothetical protein